MCRLSRSGLLRPPPLPRVWSSTTTSCATLINGPARNTFPGGCTESLGLTGCCPRRECTASTIPPHTKLISSSWPVLATCTCTSSILSVNGWRLLSRWLRERVRHLSGAQLLLWLQPLSVFGWRGVSFFSWIPQWWCCLRKRTIWVCTTTYYDGSACFGLSPEVGELGSRLLPKLWKIWLRRHNIYYEIRDFYRAGSFTLELRRLKVMEVDSATYCKGAVNDQSGNPPFNKWPKGQTPVIALLVIDLWLLSQSSAYRFLYGCCGLCTINWYRLSKLNIILAWFLMYRYSFNQLSKKIGNFDPMSHYIISYEPVIVDNISRRYLGVTVTFIVI